MDPESQQHVLPYARPDSQSTSNVKFFWSDNSSEKPTITESLPTPVVGEPKRDHIWRATWNRAVREGRWPRLVYAAAGIALGIIWIVITFHFAQGELTFNRNRKKDFIKSGLDGGGGVSLVGALKKFDQDIRVLTVSWSGFFQDPDDDIALAPLVTQDYGSSEISLNIYRDIDTTIISAPYAQESGDDGYFYIVDNATAPHIATIGGHSWDNFDTDIEFQGVGDDQTMWQQPLFGYPWDEMTGSIVFVASYVDFAVLYNVSSYVIPLSNAGLTDNSLNWRFAIKSTPICMDPTNVTEIAALPDFTKADNKTLAAITVPCYLMIDLTATRPPLVRFAVIMAVIVNWTSTLFIFILTCEVLIMRRGYMLSGTDLLSVTFTSLFALPTVRLLLPGAPDFGVLIDLIGIIPNVILISLCITAIAVAKLNRRDKSEDHNKGKDD